MRNKEQLLADMAEMERGIRDPKKTAEQKDIFRRTIDNIQKQLDALEYKRGIEPKPIAPNITPAQEQTRKENQERRNYTIAKLGSIVRNEPPGNGTPPTANTGKIQAVQPSPPPTVTIEWIDRNGKKVAETLDESQIRKKFQLVFNALVRSAGAKKKEYWRLSVRSPIGCARAATYFAAMRTLHGMEPTAQIMGVTRATAANRGEVFKIVSGIKNEIQ